MIAWASSGADLIIQNNCALQKLKVNSLSVLLCEEYWMVNLSFNSVLRIKLFIESEEYPWSWMHHDEDDGFVNAYHLFGARILPTIIFSMCFINTTTAVCSNWNLCIHSYTTHNYLLRVAFSTVMHSSHSSSLSLLCAIFSESLQSHVCNPRNEQDGSENERITIKLHPNSADRLMSICGANFKPSKSMSSLHCNVLH